MKRLTLILLILVTMGLVFGNGLAAKMIRIGEHQIVAHPALDNDSKGFKVALEEEGFIEGKNVVFDRKAAATKSPAVSATADSIGRFKRIGFLAVLGSYLNSLVQVRRRAARSHELEGLRSTVVRHNALDDRFSIVAISTTSQVHVFPNGHRCRGRS